MRILRVGIADGSRNDLKMAFNGVCRSMSGPRRLLLSVTLFPFVKRPECARRLGTSLFYIRFLLRTLSYCSRSLLAH